MDTPARLFVRPLRGLRVPVPVEPGPNRVRPRALAEAGEHVNDTTYWRRRLLDGDVELATPPASEEPAQPERARAAARTPRAEPAARSDG